MKFFFKTHLTVWSALRRHYLGVMFPASLLATVIAILVNKYAAGSGSIFFAASMLFLFVSVAAFVSFSAKTGPLAFFWELRSRALSYLVIAAVCVLICVAFSALQGNIPSAHNAMQGTYQNLLFVPLVLIALMSSLQLWMRNRVKELSVAPDEGSSKPREILIFAWLSRVRRGLGEMTTPMFHFALATMAVMLIYDFRNLAISYSPEMLVAPFAIAVSAVLTPFMMLPLIAFFRCIVAGVAQNPRALLDADR